MEATITIHDVPHEVFDALVARAAQHGVSLEGLMLDELTRLASRPSLADVLAGVQERKRRSPQRIGGRVILAVRDLARGDDG